MKPTLRKTFSLTFLSLLLYGCGGTQLAEIVTKVVAKKTAGFLGIKVSDLLQMLSIIFILVFVVVFIFIVMKNKK